MTVSLTDQALSIIAVAGATIAVIALVVAFVALRRKHPAVPPLEDRSLRKVLGDQEKAIKEIERAARILYTADRKLEAYASRRLGRVHLVRYDAFEDVGGRLSFSCAMLDDAGDGVVITSINGRRDTRVYAKPVRGGASAYSLSSEEEQAIARALSGEPPDAE